MQWRIAVRFVVCMYNALLAGTIKLAVDRHGITEDDAALIAVHNELQTTI